MTQEIEFKAFADGYPRKAFNPYTGHAEAIVLYNDASMCSSKGSGPLLTHSMISSAELLGLTSGALKRSP